MSENRLPADPIALILGIAAILLGIGGCCVSVMFFPFAFLAFIPFILSIIGLVMSNRSLRTYKKNPELYAQSSKGNVVAARIINLVSVIFGSLIILTTVIGIVAFGTAFYEALEDIDARGSSWEDSDIYEYDDEIESDILELDSTFLIEEVPVEAIDTLDN